MNALGIGRATVMSVLGNGGLAGIGRARYWTPLVMAVQSVLSVHGGATFLGPKKKPALGLDF